MPRERMVGVNSREDDGEAVSELRTEPHTNTSCDMISRFRRVLTVISESVLSLNMRCACLSVLSESREYAIL
jgi:hypothetical protein